MMDIVERLRKGGGRYQMCRDAADEIERLRVHIEELQEKIDAETSCACSYDNPDDVCMGHSPALEKAKAEIERLRENNA